MKKLINAVENVVNESLAGFCAAHFDIVRIGEHAAFVQRRHLSRHPPADRVRQRLQMDP